MSDLSFYKNKKVFITGHTGFKGTWLCHMLLHAGAEVTGYALEPPDGPSLFIQTGLDKKIHSIIADIRNRDTLRQAMQEAQPEMVFHLAAQPIVRRSYREPALTFETNIMGTVNVLDVLRFTPSVRSFVNVTTDKVYENREWYWPYRENETLCGLDPYSNSKSCGELVTYSYRLSFFSGPNSPAISTARSGNVIGGGDYSEDRIIPDCVKAVKAKKEIILRNPHAIRPYQHVLDGLSGYMLLAEMQYKEKTLEGAYNFGPDDESCVTSGRLADLFCGAWGEGASWKEQSDGGPHEADLLKLDCSKSKSVLGWEPRCTIMEAVARIVEFEKQDTDGGRLKYIQKQIGEVFFE